MRPLHPFQKHFCVLFLSLALLTAYTALRKKHKHQIYIENKLVNQIDLVEQYIQTNISFSETYFDDILKLNLSSYKKVSNKHQMVYILGLFEFTTKWGKRLEGESELLAAKLAVNHVNAVDLLPGYTLELLVNDTECDPGVGIDRFFHALYSKKTILMLLGAGCSNVSERLAHVVPYWNIIQVSFGSISPSLSDRNKFPLFFRTVAPDSSHNSAKIQFVKTFKWEVVATFSQSENEYLLPVNHLITDLEKVNVSCISTVTFSLENYKEQLKVLKDLDIRIIFGSFSNTVATKIFCAVYELGMYGEYVWILQNRDQLWWNFTTDCSLHELQKAVEGTIIISDYNSISEDQFSLSGLGNDDFEEALNISNLLISKYAKQVYDAIWTIALALRNSERYNWLDQISDYHYERKDMVCRWMERISKLNFIGLSGPVKFQGADRIGNSLIQQIVNGKKVDVAIFDSINNDLNFNCKTCHKILWKNYRPPIARRILKVSLITIPDFLFYFVAVTSFMGISISLLFLYFNLHFRRMKSVKLSSPKLNNVAVFGCIFVYLSVILLDLHNTTATYKGYFSELCSIRVYLLSAGFSLVFGSMFAKTYRVHRLFTYLGAGLVKDKLLKDKQLIGLISVPLIMDAIILTLWVAIDPLERQLYNLTLEISSTQRETVYQPQVEVCGSHNTVGWYVALFGYKSIILIMGVFMAWKTRHVKIPALNDSQYIGICVYSAVFCTIIVILSSFISNYVVLTYLAKTISILISTTITLFLLFLPKLKEVFRRVDCEDPIMLSMGLKVESNTRRFILDDPREQICRLEIQNKVYRCQLASLDKEISRLEELLALKSSVSLKTSVNVTRETVGDCYYLRVPTPAIGRASWPSAECQLISSKKLFLSDNKLNSLEKIKLFEKLKKLFGSFNSLHTAHPPHDIHQDIDLLGDRKHERRKPRSSPEIYRQLRPLIKPLGLTKAMSELSINRNKLLK